MTTRRPRIASEAFPDNPTALLAVNNGFAALADRIDALSAMRIVRIQPIEFTTGSSYAAGTAPLPLRIGVGSLPVVGLFVGRVEVLTSPDTVLTTAVWPDWRLLTDGTLEVRYLSGLTTSTRYRVHFLGVANA